MKVLCLQSAPAVDIRAFSLGLGACALAFLSGCGEAGPKQPQSGSTTTSGPQNPSISTTLTDTTIPSTQGPGSTLDRPSSPDSTTGNTPTSSGPELAPISIQFKAMFGNQPFACGQSYEGIGTNAAVRIEPIDFRFYVHNLRLTNAQGQDVPVQIEDREPWQISQLALIDFEDSQGACASAGDPGVNAQITGFIPAGNYRGLKFSNSVPAKLNHANPTGLGAPLHAGGMTWGWLTGYKFFAAEIRQSNAANGTSPGSALFHIGSQACDAGPEGIACSKSNRNEIVFADFDPGNHQIVVNLAPIFAQADLSKANPCHSATPICDSMFNAVGVDWSTGQQQPTQTVFSMEAKTGVLSH